MQYKKLSSKYLKRKGAMTQLHSFEGKWRTLKQLFRDPSDRGEQRTMATPSPEIIVEKIKAFIKQWGDTEIASISLLHHLLQERRLITWKIMWSKAVYLEYRPLDELTEMKQYIKI